MTEQKSTQGFLCVPIRLQAMCLDVTQSVVRAMADYRRLPFFDGQILHDDNPNVSEHILRPPFAQDLPLPAGIHLHWLLPDALTRGEHDEAGTRFPQVPNRWLVLRSGGGEAEKQWVVESDYLYPAGYGDDIPSEGEAPVNVLAVPDPGRDVGYRYRFLGRAQTLDAWRAGRAETGNEYLPVLTSVGAEVEVAVLDPVRATFAAFYPNCRTVFGFHDADFPTRTPPAGLQYDVIGWYADPTRDRLASLLAEATTPEALRALLEEHLSWVMPEGAALPGGSIYHARLAFAPSARAARNVVAELPRPSLTMAQTETEAVAAYLAHVHAPETNEAALAQRRIVEDQLEALQLTDRLEGHTLDLDALLTEARHERGFASLSAGLRWSIQPATDTREDLFAMVRRSRTLGPRTPPPAAWTVLLEALNAVEEEYQRATDELESLRQRMYVRWHALTNKKDIVDSEFSLSYIVPVRLRLTSMGRLRLEQDEATGAFRAELDPVTYTIITRAFRDYAKYQGVLDKGVPFELENSSVDSYWMWTREFEDCGDIKLSAQHTVKVVSAGEAWEVTDGGIVYAIQAGVAGITLEIPASASSIAGRFAAALAALQTAVDQHNATAAGAASPYALRALPAAPYWEAADPVLLVTGPAATGAIWQGEGEDDLLTCAQVATALDFGALPTATITALKSHLAALGPDVGQTWTEAPWNPFMMDWSLHVAPCGRDVNGDYDASLVIDNYTLGVQGIDATLRAGKESSFSRIDDTYSGTSLLTPSGSLEVRERIVHYLEEELLPDYYAAIPIADDLQVKGYLEESFDLIKAWYLKQNPSAGVEDPMFTSLFAYEELKKTPCLAQSLGNFNQVLLLREPVLQLGMVDITSPTHSASVFYTDSARDAMGDSIQRRPLVMDRFNPVRAGAMSINGLSLIDTFGQVKVVVDIQDPSDAKVITTTDQTPPPGVLHQALLSPRLAQPARLRFEWLPAEPTGGRRTNDHPGTNPVCGFLLVNNLDGALAVYDKEGRALGSVDRANAWRTAPESGSRVRMNARGAPQLPNAHLQRVVDHVLGTDATFLRSFLSVQRTALETIDPEAYAACPSRALLMARAVAVVRASLTLELQGPPAFDPSAVADDTTTTRDLEKVKFPVRLGEFGQLDDGLVGYFVETPDGAYENGLFYSPQERDAGHAKIRTHADGEDAMSILRTASDPDLNVTLLLDPRAQVHATIGVVPSPQIRLAPEHYTKALESMEVSFLTAPLLTDLGALRLEVPEEPGYAWSWVTQEPDGAWTSTSALSPPNARASFSAPLSLREGWLLLRRAEGGGE